MATHAQRLPGGETFSTEQAFGEKQKMKPTTFGINEKFSNPSTGSIDNKVAGRTGNENGFNCKHAISNSSGAANALEMVVALNDELLSAGLKFLLRNAAHDVVLASHGPNGSPAKATSMKPPQIMILAQNSSSAGSLAETITRLQCLPKAPKVVVLLERAEDTLEIAKLNVDGIVMSSPQIRQLLECIENIGGGRRWVDPDVLSVAVPSQRMEQDCLTLRERQIVEGVVRGLRNKEIARKMHLSESTIKMHLHRIFQKLRLESRMQLAMAYSSPDQANGKGTPNAH